VTRLNIAGKLVDVDDSFLKLSQEDQGKTVDEIAGQIGTEGMDGPHGQIPNAVAARATAIKDIGQGRAEGVQMLRGVPIAGAYADKATAALNAAAEPLFDTGLSKAKTFGERMAENERRVKSGANAYQEENPIKAGIEQLAGGTAAVAPLGASGVAARALGMSGTLPQMVTRGALSNAAIGAVDEAARGGSPSTGAEVGAITGAGLPVAGRLIGKAVQGMRGAPRELPAMPTADVAGVPVPQFKSSLTGDNAAGSFEQEALAGARGEGPQRVAQQAFDARNAAMEQAKGNFGAELSPQTSPSLGAPPGATSATPHTAGDQVITELAQQHNDQVQQNALRGIAGEVSDLQTRQAMQPPGAPPAMPADAHTAAEGVGGTIQQNAQRAAQARTAAYQTAGNTPGTYNPAGFERISNSLEQRLNSGAPEQRVRVNDTTPRTREGLALIEQELGTGRRPTNEVNPRVTNYNAALDEGVQLRPAPPITPRDVEAVRQQLVPLVRDANNAARAPGGSYADARGMRRLMDAFDQHVRDVVTAGGFSGDGEALLRRYDTARQAHSQYRGLFSARGQGDVVGPVVEKIIGKHPGQESTPDAIAQAMYGSSSAPGGGATVQVAQRVRNIVGENSPAWGASKQGLLSHILDTPAGTEALAPAEQAARIRNLLTSTKSRTLAQVYFSPEERNALLAHADTLERLVPNRGPQSPVDKQIMRLSGADGHPPASSRDAVDMLFSGDGTKASTVQLASRLKTTLSPESWDSVRQGMWTHLTSKPEGMIEFGPQALSQRLHKFLSEPIASTMYTPRELQIIKIIADEYKKMIPLPNTTNPSGSGVMASKVVRAAQGNLFALLGLAMHGVPGVLAGAGAQKALQFAAGRRAVAQTQEHFYGKPVKPELKKNYERAAAILAHAATPLAATGQ